jgi:hypothetical protein
MPFKSVVLSGISRNIADFYVESRLLEAFAVSAGLLHSQPADKSCRGMKEVMHMCHSYFEVVWTESQSMNTSENVTLHLYIYVVFSSRILA